MKRTTQLPGGIDTWLLYGEQGYQMWQDYLNRKRKTNADKYRCSKERHELSYIKYGKKSVLSFNNYQNLLRAHKVAIPGSTESGTGVYYRNWSEVTYFAWRTLRGFHYLRRDIERYRRAQRQTGGRIYVTTDGQFSITNLT